ncbi:ATP synthase F0 subunit A [Paenibacillus sp. MY03]|jgi:F-type H+-transporting ATPase subunit a|uniref:F0F1 ATP synthase subunit A n=1 Tax=unclassified Paenibacillus TaxID=185978 RepID=UPI000B3CAABB|nr:MULTISPECIES: F0F1 ATP synthase subunit A [unclassified Paenibacillus]OUS75214.1 ATP synthase F0 subunit A [Paenibacillus sp. MY03]QNK58291.1 F0F1 ATP synthase subunit A [Paenibacillus sp. PAMC21692]
MHLFPIVNVFGLDFDLSAIIAILVSCVITFIVARLAVRNLSVDKPTKMQNFMEWVTDFMHSTIASSMPVHKVRPYLALGMTLIMFILISNLLGLPFMVVTDAHEPIKWLGIDQAYLDSHGGAAHIAWWKSPTADLAVTAGLAIVVFVLVHFLGLKLNRKHYLHHYLHPYPVFFPVNIIETIAKPLTLALRLYANIYAGEVLISTILMMGFAGIPFMIAWQGFSIFVGAIQAFLFTVLTMVYISQATVHDDDEHVEAAAKH